jgi:hypothetical protein
MVRKGKKTERDAQKTNDKAPKAKATGKKTMGVKIEVIDPQKVNEESQKAMEEQKKRKQERRNEEMQKILKNPHKVIGLKNNVPCKYVLWYRGLPLKMTFKKEDILEEPIPFRNQEKLYSDGFLSHIIKAYEEDKRTIIMIDSEVFSLDEFVNDFADPRYKTDFRFAIEALPMSEMQFCQPFIKQEGDFFICPEKMYPRRDLPLQKEFVKNLNIGPVDPSIVGEGFQMLRKYPKQWTLARMIVGATVTNWLELNDYSFGIKAIGPRDSGKSFAIKVMNRLGFGISPKFYLQNDSLNSPFRSALAASLTNFPLYIEEMKKSDLSDQKAKGINFRGTKDQSIKIYEKKSTLIFSANRDVLHPDMDEQLAIDKRIKAVYFDENDVIPDEEKSHGLGFLEKLEKSPGGIVFEHLKNKKVQEIRDKAYEFINICQ